MGTHRVKANRGMRALALLLFACCGVARAGVHVDVNTTADEFGAGSGCSLREALYTIHHGANFGGCTRSGALLFDRVNLPAGTYAISLAPVAANPEAGGAFKIDAPVSIVGAGAGTSIVDGGSIDSVFAVAPGAGQSVQLSGMTIRNGLSSNNVIGAGIHHTSGTLGVTNVWVTANLVGNGIRSQDTDGLQLSQVTISNNNETALVIYTLSGTLTASLENTTITDNVSKYRAGALELTAANGGTVNLTIANSTIAYNTGVAAGLASGGISLVGNGSHTVIRNSIIARNLNTWREDANCASNPNTITSQGYNLLGPQYLCTFVGNTANDIVGVDPQLAPLFDYGSGVPTRAAYPGSPALGAGNPAVPGSGGAACAVIDARGISRGNTQPCDIGAYEYHVDWRPNSTQDISDIIADGSCNTGFGVCTLRGAIDEANAAGRPVTIEIPAGNYAITKAPATQNSNVDGNFFVTTLFPVTLVGAGADKTFIDGGGLDSVLALGSNTFGGVALHGLTIRNGKPGGVFVNHGPALFDHTRVTANTSFFGNGVAILNGGSADFVASTIDDNLTFGTTMFCGGGGIAADAGTRVTLLNSTVANNHSTRYGSGICSNGANVTIAFSTIANNVQAPDSSAGGLSDGANPGTWHIINSIVSGNKLSDGSDADCAANLQVDGHTLVRTATGCTFGGQHSDQVMTAVDPQLSQLLMQGGSTPTIGLGPASPAHTAVQLADCVDRSGNQLLFDQRDVLRTLYDGSGMPQYCDLGAFQGSSDVIFIDSFE